MTRAFTSVFTYSGGRLTYFSSILKPRLKRVTFRPQSPRLVFSRPGLRYGPSPLNLNTSDRRSWLDRFIARCLAYRTRCKFTEGSSSDWLECMTRRVSTLARLTTNELDDNRAALILKLRQGVPDDDNLDDALSHALLAVQKTRQIDPRSNQRLAARAMLQGLSVEMATGEGKTLTVALAAGAAALSGTPIHVLTANDYLAERDASFLYPVFKFLGVRVASVTSSQTEAERRHAYMADVVYVTAKQVAFDWLSDSLEIGIQTDSLTARLSVLTNTTSGKNLHPMLRGLCLAIVDEADSLLVDEARIPLVLAATQEGDAAEEIEAVIALGLAEQLREGIDYRVLSTTRTVHLTDSGCRELTTMAEKVAHTWRASRYREARVEQALTVLHWFERDRDYIVRDGRLELMDAHTGRAMPDRRLPHGLHRMLEVKEKCIPSPQHDTVATVPFQHFFRQYVALVGISGTMSEVAGEIHHVYERFVVPVASHRPCRRVDHSSLVFKDRSAQLQAMVDEVRRCQEHNQPVLVGTRSVEQSLGVSAMLTAHGLVHHVLNAYQDAEEAAIVAAAGQAGQLTVATNMAGRGTDIPLGPGVAELGGLHVISLAFNDAGRLDRQLAGRTARQGAPGSYQQYYCLEDSYLVEVMSAWFRQCARTCIDIGWQRGAVMLIHLVQRFMELKQRRQRLLLYQSRERLERQLAFGGKPDNLS